MPAESKAQQRAAQMAEHASPDELASAGPAVKQMASSMSHGQLHDFAVGSEKGKPEHVKPRHSRKHESKHGRGAKPRGGF